MPVKHFLRTRRTVPMPYKEMYAAIAELTANGYSSDSLLYSDYQEVPGVLAELDKEKGAFAYYSYYTGRRISDFIPVHMNPASEEALSKETSNPRTTVLEDSIRQLFYRGDYVLSHNHQHTALELNQVVRNLTTKSVVRSFAYPWSEVLRTRNTGALLRIPTEFIEGGDAPVQEWTLRYATPQGVLCGEKEARETNGRFRFFDAEGFAVSSQFPIGSLQTIELGMEDTQHGKHRLVQENELGELHTDAMGVAIRLGDWVFSDDNHHTSFAPCKVIGFSRDRVRVVSFHNRRATVNMNWPKNTVKLPINIKEHPFLR